MATKTLRLDEPTDARLPVSPSRASSGSRFARLIRLDPLSTIVTIAIDVLSASVATFLAYWWVSKSHEATPPLWMILLYVPTVIGMLAARRVYRRRLNRKFLDEIGPIEATVALASMFLLTLMTLGRVPGDTEQTVLRVWICAAVLMPTGRLIRAAIQRSLRRHHHLMSPTLIVGNGRIATRIVERLKSMPELGLDPVGLIDAEAPWAGPDGSTMPALPNLGTPETIEQAILQTGAEGVVVAFSRTEDELLTHVVRVAHHHEARVWVVPRMFDVIGSHARFEHVGGLPLIALAHTNPRGWQFAIKHFIDRVCSSLGLLLISPLFLTLMLLVRLSSPGPIFFRQPRVGRDGKVFDCLKFRTMRPPRPSDADFELKSGAAPGGVEGVDRRTAIGKIMRATSMDELPQLINVIKGEMSLVGPRPERPEFVELFEMQIRRYGERHRVKAGMTGWAQVHGLRGQTSIADRAEWDNYYIENWSLTLDFKILLLTVLAVLRRAPE